MKLWSLNLSNSKVKGQWHQGLRCCSVSSCFQIHRLAATFDWRLFFNANFSLQFFVRICFIILFVGVRATVSFFKYLSRKLLLICHEKKKLKPGSDWRKFLQLINYSEATASPLLSLPAGTILVRLFRSLVSLLITGLHESTKSLPSMWRLPLSGITRLGPAYDNWCVTFVPRCRK